jgi:hypothetical protein
MKSVTMVPARLTVRRFFWRAGAVATLMALLGGAQAQAAVTGTGTTGTGHWRLAYHPAMQGGLISLAATGPRDAWATGFLEQGQNLIFQPYVLRWNGTTWRRVTVPGSGGYVMISVSASSARNVWLFGASKSANKSQVFRFDGISWHRSAGPANGGAGALVLGPKNAWAMLDTGCYSSSSGQTGCVTDLSHWTGGAWKKSSVPADISSLGGSAVAGAWAVGLSGKAQQLPDALVAYHWTGTRWAVPAGMPHPKVNGSLGVGADSGSDVWVAALTPDNKRILLLHWNGHSWTQRTSPVSVFAGISNGVVPDGHGGAWVGFWHWTGHAWVNTGQARPAGFDFSRVVKVPGTTGSYWAAGVLARGNGIFNPAIALYGPKP